MESVILYKKAGYLFPLFLSIPFLLMLCTRPSFSQSSGSGNVLQKAADNRYEILDQQNAVLRAREKKSETAAMVYSLLATSLPVGIGAAVESDAGIMMMAFGVSIGPSAGILYSEDIDRAAAGMGVRTSGVGMAAIGGLFHVIDSLGDNDGLSVGNVLIAGGLSMTAISMLYDIFIESPKAARRYNEGSGEEGIEVAPWASTAYGAAGLKVKWRF
ncbi:MAG: hypothetical protein GVY08_00335 [Bacteroidetes bacterium]|jgi:hypothetical protein|nr:hypothetical protein [Bacteroidota bacterium]